MKFASSRWRYPVRNMAWLTIALVTVASFAIVVAPLLLSEGPTYRVGQVVSEDILAPRALQFESEILTRQQQDANARAVNPIYSPPDSSIARQQVNHLRDTLAYIESVRADAFATQQQKVADLRGMQYAQLSTDDMQHILALNDAGWQVLQQEAIRVLEQVMRTSIRESQLDSARSSIPALVSLSLSEDQAELVAHLVAPFVIPNSLYSPELTDAAREEARAAVTPVQRTFVPGETIVSRGHVLNELDIEALEAFGLTHQTGSNAQLWGSFALVITLMTFSAGYIYKAHAATLLKKPRSLLVLALLYLAFLFTTRWAAMSGPVWAYIFPVSAFGLTVSALFGIHMALFAMLPLTILATYGAGNSLLLLLFYLSSTIAGILVLHPARRLSAFVRAGLASSLGGMVILLVIPLTLTQTTLSPQPTLLAAATFQGIISAMLTLILQFGLAQFLGETTEIQLMELARPDHPLLQYLLRQAPGTYQHSLQVANLAEQAAEVIGADTFLTRVGALYHDVGKARNPIFFIENQVPGSTNPHDSFPPAESAAIIIRHVTDGLELARKYRLPRRLQDFISEHHGNSLTAYQYTQALNAAGDDAHQIDIRQFRYPGPRPQSRETAILMLADGCEAITRARPPGDKEELRQLIRAIITKRREEGQLDDADLTLRDLARIEDCFVSTLQAMYHPRIKYPKLQEQEEHASRTEVPTTPPATQQTETPHGKPAT
ncbi:MAG: HDIG domain-containing protein [Anaerolineae bacterium]|nr:MAG: HDIG domain-containing protein [Anaerolineae bacterium]